MPFSSLSDPFTLAMLPTAAQMMAFFEEPAQMGIPHATVVQLTQEGIESVDDLADFDKNSLQQLTTTCDIHQAECPIQPEELEL